jgi:hypothetical protein
MADKNRTDIRKTDFLVIRSQRNDDIVKIITPQYFQVGLPGDASADVDFDKSLIVYGNINAASFIASDTYITASQRIGAPLVKATELTGSLTKLIDGSSYLKGGSNITIATGSTGQVTISASGFSNSSLTIANGLQLDSGTTYDGTAPRTLSPKFVTAGGLKSPPGTAGMRVDFDNLNHATVTTTDMLLFGDVSNGVPNFPKRTTVADILALGTAGTLANPITFGDGIYDSVGGATSYNNTSAPTIAVLLATDPGLNLSSGKLKIKLDGTTLSLGPSGISAVKVPNALSQGTGISTLAYDGSATATVSIDTTTVPQLASNNTFSGNNTFSDANTFTGINTFGTILATHDEVSSGVPYLVAGSNVSVSYNTPATGQITIAASLGSGGALTQGSGIASFTYDGTSATTVAMDATSLSASGNRNSYAFLSNGGASITKQLVSTLIDEVDRTAIMSEGTGIDITFNGNSNPAIIAVKLDGTTISTDGSGNITVDKVPNALSQGTGIKAFSFDGSSARSVIVDNSVVAFLTGSQFSGDIGITGSLEVEKNTILRGLTLLQGKTRALHFTGSLQTLLDGTSYLREGKQISVLTQSNGGILISFVPAPGGGSGGGNSDKSAEYLVLSSTGSLSAERVMTMGTGLMSTDAGAGGNYTIKILDSIVATLTGSQFSGNVGITGSFSVEDDSIFKTGLTGSLQILPDGITPYIIGTGSISVTTASSGQLVISSSNTAATSTSVSVSQIGGSFITDVSKFIFSSSIVTNDGSNQVTIKPVIGSAEDGTYTDGLFTDLTYSTPIGTAVDRFNEVLKGLAPGAAPSLDNIDCNDAGVSAKLSFGSSQSISGYVNVQPSTLTPTDNLSDVDINTTYSSTIVSNDVRVACFTGVTVINGTLNADVTADGSNYAADSFGNGDQGTLKLFVNDNTTPVHTVDVSTFGSGNSLATSPASAIGSGFNLTAKTSGHFSDGSNFETFQHRQGTYTIEVAAQRSGWNYARVVHTIGSSDTTCNYVEWVNDPEATALSSDNSAMDSLSMTGTKNLSGVKYNTGGSAEYRIRVLNAYRNVYSTSNITFTGTNASVPSQSFPIINYGSAENEAKILHLTGSATITADPILNGSITASTNVPHPLKTNLSSAGSQSISGILLYDLSNTSTTTSETFRAENYRIKSGSYTAQANVTDLSNAWSSTTSLITVDGMLFYNSRLYSPDQGGVSGDFRNIVDGGSIANGPSSNVNYSTISSGLRTFYRYFQNTSGGSKSNWSLTANGSGTIVAQGTALNSSRIHILAKLPTTSAAFSTGWMDIALAFATGQVGDGDGCLDGSLDSSLNATNTGTFGTQSVGSNEYVVIKIEADATWTGYISSMSISWS